MNMAQEFQLHFYGLMIGASLLLGWASGDTIIRKASWLMLIGWAFANISVQLLGFGGAPLVVPAFNALIAVLIGMLGYKHRSTFCFYLVLLYLAQEIVAVVGFATHNQGTNLYYVLENGVFIARMFVVGGWSVARMAVRSRGEHGGVRHRVSGG